MRRNAQESEAFDTQLATKGDIIRLDLDGAKYKVTKAFACDVFLL
ncbi:MAG: hypothetical protein Q9M16_03480 [Mariprofundus sp.]|nr:hypothetical protein [Mariprofundus sp.]